MRDYIIVVLLYSAIHPQAGVSSDLPRNSDGRSHNSRLRSLRDFRAESKIFNGIRASETPFVVSIQVGLPLPSYTQICTATRITENQLLTSARCFDNTNSEFRNADFRAVLGTTRKDGVGGVQIDFKYSHVTVHPLFNNITFYFDFAIITLPQKLENSNTIRSVKLAKLANFEGIDTVTCMGWGRFDCVNFSPWLLYATGSIIDHSECKELWAQHNNGAYPQFLNHQICALFHTVGGASLDNGDSGSPLLVSKGNELVQIGVLSYGSSANGPAGSDKDCINPAIPQVFGVAVGVMPFIKKVAPKAQFISVP